MYLDDAVVAGVLVVVGACIFFGGFIYYAVKDAHKKKK